MDKHSAVIGTVPAGLAQPKNLTQRGIEATMFEIGSYGSAIRVKLRTTASSFRAVRQPPPGGAIGPDLE